MKFTEITEKNGTFVGQVNDKNEKYGRGAFILKESQNTVICYWDNNIMKGDGIFGFNTKNNGRRKETR